MSASLVSQGKTRDPGKREIRDCEKNKSQIRKLTYLTPKVIKHQKKPLKHV